MAVTDELRALLRPQEQSRLAKISEVGGAVASQIGGGPQVSQTLRANEQLRTQQQGQQFSQAATLAQLDMKEAELQFNQVLQLAKQGNEDAKAAQDMVEFFIKEYDFPGGPGAFVQGIANAEEDVTQSNSMYVGSRVASELGGTRKATASTPKYTNYFDPNTKEIFRINESNQAEVDDARARGAYAVGLTAQVGTVEGLAPAPKEVTAAGPEARDASANIARLSSLLSDFEAAGPGAAGYRRAIASTGSALIGQLNQAAGEGFSEFFAGVGTEELQAIVTRSRAAIASSIEQFTGEESGRFTEQERALAEEAQRLLENATTLPQIRAALGVAISLDFVHRDRQLMVGKQPPAYDLATRQGIIDMATELGSLGLSAHEAARTIKEIQLQRRLIEETL